jgi:hypothetical protein
MFVFNRVVIGVAFSILSSFVLKDPDTIFAVESLQALITQMGVVLLLLYV